MIPKRQTHKLKSLEPVFVMLASIAVPLIVAYFGNSISLSLKESENRVKYVELAVTVLSGKPTGTDRPLRQWAIELLDSQSPIKLSDGVRQNLLLEQLVLPRRVELSGNALLDSVFNADLSVTRNSSPNSEGEAKRNISSKVHGAIANPASSAHDATKGRD